MTIIQLVQLIRDEYSQDLRSEKEKEFIAEMYDGLQGLPQNLCIEDVGEYLTPRQVEWIKDITVSLGIE